MFCGQCGRAITTSDWAAFRASEGATPPVDERPEGVRPWALREPPVASVPAGTPWWVNEGDEPRDEDDDSDVVDDPVPAPAPASQPAPLSQPASAFDESSAFLNDTAAVASSSVDDEPGAQELRAAPAEPAPAPAAPVAGAHAAPSAPAPSGPPAAASPAPAELPPPAASSPTPLRPPGAAESGSRPGSVPLWTASITPITADGEPVSAAPQASESESATPAAVRPASPLTPPSSAAAPSSADAPSSAGAPSSAAAPAPASAPVSAPADVRPAATQAARDASAQGDTDVIPPLASAAPAAAPLVAPGAHREAGRVRCTNCGAPIGEDDIFCGECGIVVEHIAQAFTGPIPSLPPASAQSAPASAPAPTPNRPASASGPVSTPVAAPADVPAPREAPLAPTPLPSASTPALPPFVADPEPAAKRRRLFGRRQADRGPQLWSGASASSPTAEVPPMPAAGPATPASAPAQSEPPVAAQAVPAPLPSSVPAPASGPSEPPVRATPTSEVQPLPAAIPDVPPVPQPEPSAAPWAVHLGAPADDTENTRIVARAPLGEPFVLQFSTGESFTVQGTGLVGRAPTPQPGEAIDLLVRIFDPGRSVSKTHLEFGQDDGALWISDRWSGNGTVVHMPTSEVRRVEPGKRVRVARGSRIEIGEQFFIVN
ncbi:FHA domain-containing protein [Frondihabitans sp. PhB188]|nr:FHA domain-containing protein [Frondihabitans sp. PhB188]ROQ41273.1 FHA domain-containing protein [Frondihabitans sp. PhB188]